MQPLSELQKNWLEAVITGQPVILRPAILQPPRDSADVRIAIYADAYILRLLDTLAIIFPYLKKWLGQEKFDAIGTLYFKDHPSTYYAVKEIALAFPTFLEKYYKDAVYRELAALELAISETVDLPEKTVITREALQKIPQEEWGDVVFTLHPTFTLLPFHTNAIAIYEALLSDQNIPVSEKINLIHCRIWRKELQVYYLIVTPAEATFLQGLLAQHTFGEICEKLCEQLPEEEVVSFAISQLLRWLDEGLLVSADIRKSA